MAVEEVPILQFGNGLIIVTGRSDPTSPYIVDFHQIGPGEFAEVGGRVDPEIPRGKHLLELRFRGERDISVIHDVFQTMLEHVRSNKWRRV